jgi:hypothetical protein
MATRASTFVTAWGLGTPVPMGGSLHLEFYRIQGGTVGDTVTVTPQRGRYVVAAIGGALGETTVGTAGTDTQVVWTVVQSATSTSVTYDAVIYVAD